MKRVFTSVLIYALFVIPLLSSEHNHFSSERLVELQFVSKAEQSHSHGFTDCEQLHRIFEEHAAPLSQDIFYNSARIAEEFPVLPESYSSLICISSRARGPPLS